MQCVIVVDDNADASRSLVRVIERLGYCCKPLPGGEAALDYLHRHPADLVILDLCMPGMDGIEVLRRIRRDPRLSGLRVVIFSAVADDRFQRRAKELGAHDYWIKGALDIATMHQRLQTVLPPPGSSPAPMSRHP